MLFPLSRRTAQRNPLPATYKKGYPSKRDLNLFKNSEKNNFTYPQKKEEPQYALDYVILNFILKIYFFENEILLKF